jgi:hypothetical protein
MSALIEDAVGKLIDIAARTAKDLIAGKVPDPEALALEVADLGLDLVGHEVAKRLLTQAAAARIDAEVDVEMREATRS